MGRPKGGTNKYWTAEEKYEVIKPIINFEKKFFTSYKRNWYK